MTDATPTAAPATGAVNPGKTTGIVGLILAFLLPLIGFIVSLVARSQSKKAGFKNGPAVAGIIIGALGTVALIIAIVAGVSLAAGVASQCATLGPGSHMSSDGITTITCG